MLVNLDPSGHITFTYPLSMRSVKNPHSCDHGYSEIYSWWPWHVASHVSHVSHLTQFLQKVSKVEIWRPSYHNQHATFSKDLCRQHFRELTALPSWDCAKQLLQAAVCSDGLPCHTSVGLLGLFGISSYDKRFLKHICFHPLSKCKRC